MSFDQITSIIVKQKECFTQVFIRCMIKRLADITEEKLPIATPMSAFFNAGESLTPSPVTATIWPWRLNIYLL